MRIGPVENCSPTLLALKDSFRQHGWTIIERFLGTLYYLELPKNVADYVPMIGGHAKKVDYYLRRVKKRGDVSITVKIGLSSNEWQDTLRELQKIESESWVASSGEPRFMGEKNFRFWMDLLQDYDMSRSIKIWMMYLDDDPVSFCLVLDAGSIRYQLVNGYSKSVKQYSTGHILFKEMIFDAIETGVERICFGLGDPGHKGEWGARPSVELTNLIAMKPGLFGKLASVAHNTTTKFVKLLKLLVVAWKRHGT
jgi:CelD/BcsL family acetyltransferase involved in cellulose biosynthesis